MLNQCKKTHCGKLCPPLKKLNVFKLRWTVKGKINYVLCSCSNFILDQICSKISTNSNTFNSIFHFSIILVHSSSSNYDALYVLLAVNGFTYRVFKKKNVSYSTWQWQAPFFLNRKKSSLTNLSTKHGKVCLEGSVDMVQTGLARPSLQLQVRKT